MHEIARGPLPPLMPREATPDRLVLFHAGRVVRTKGLRDVIRALGHLKDRPGITLTSAGTGEDMAACQAEVTRLGLDSRVTFLGRIPPDAVEEQYRRTDVFCFPSFREPLGGVLLEAMANGLPVITAARGGPDFVVDDSSGIRVPVTDPETFARGIADAIRALADDPDRRLALGRGARARIEAMDDWDQKATRVLGLYDEILTARRDDGQA
jgi:glycosyltransferase involved in cell wall biosynthesis